MTSGRPLDFTDPIGAIPYRLALAGGWIDQPFMSRHNPDSFGSMVVVSVEPTFWFMERAGLATSTRNTAMEIWRGELPSRPPEDLVRELYVAENRDRTDPSGSQDMAGIVYPGISRLDYDFEHEGGVFPRRVESTNDPEIAAWLQRVIHILPVNQRPAGYDPLEGVVFDPVWVRRLGQSGKDCYEAILARDVAALGAAMNETMTCWDVLVPHSFRHPTITVDLPAILRRYQDGYPGAVYSGCGGGYLYVISGKPVPGAFNVTIRLAPHA
ncbi:MAG: hypothetical protein Q8W46_10815 [Candidatus Palauibacterales bacterium]|nr:hypothetical protein [Candidatus Palauibacterales bacterium]